MRNYVVVDEKLDSSELPEEEKFYDFWEIIKPWVESSRTDSFSVAKLAWKQAIMAEREETEFILFWKFGKIEIIKGRTIAEAFSNAGYGGGALRALDHYDIYDPEKEKHQP